MFRYIAGILEIYYITHLIISIDKGYSFGKQIQRADDSTEKPRQHIHALKDDSIKKSRHSLHRNNFTGKPKQYAQENVRDLERMPMQLQRQL